MLLDRDAGPSNAFWERASRGDLVVIEPAPAAGGKGDREGQLLRIGRGARVADASVDDSGESR
jgi:hypothetical protein